MGGRPQCAATRRSTSFGRGSKGNWLEVAEKRGLVRKDGRRRTPERGTWEYLGEPLRASWQKEILDMSLEGMEKELAASRWKPKPEDDLTISEEELLARMEETAQPWMQTLRRKLNARGPCHHRQ